MNQVSGHFLPGSTLPKDQYGHIDVRQKLCLHSDLAHHRTGSHEELPLLELFNAVCGTCDPFAPLVSQVAHKHPLQFSLLQGDIQVIMRAETNGVDNLPSITFR